MNWIVFFLGSWVMMGLELGLRDGLQLGATGAAPSFVLLYLVFLALSAPRSTAVWTGLILGLMLDLTRAMPAANGLSVVTSIGPMALGGAMAAYTVTMVRGAVYQRNPIAAPVIVALAVFLAHLVSIALLATRSWYDPSVTIVATTEVAFSALVAGYTALVAFVVLILFGRAMPLLAALFMFDVTPSSWRWGQTRRMGSAR